MPQQSDTVASSAPEAIVDTLVYGHLRNSRIGFNSYVFANRLISTYRLKKSVLHADAGQNFLYNKNLTGGGGRYVQEDYHFLLEHIYALKPSLGLGYTANTYVFRAIGNSFGRYEGVVQWYPNLKRVNLYTEGSAGLAFDRRGVIENVGPSYRWMVTGTAQSKDSGTQYFWQGQTAQAFITPRQMAYFAGKAGFTQQVKSFGETRMTLGYLRRRVEDYLSNQIQEIRSDSVEVTLFIGSQLGKQFDFQSDNRVLVPTRQFNYRGYDSVEASIQNTRFRQTEVFSRQTLGYRGNRFQQTLSVELTQRNRVYDLDNNLGLPSGNILDNARASEKIKDIAEATVSYTYTGMLRLSSRSNLKGSWAGTLLRVNTPSDQNDQDRDETFYTSDIAWTHRWLRTLRTTLRASGSVRDVSFIKSTQSAQNYTERVIRLEPQVSYALGRMRLSGLFGVWATYNVRQFAQEEAKNRANRIWIQNYQARYQANHRWYYTADILRRENRIAQLNWANFTESPIDTVVITDLHVRIGKSFRSQKGSSELSVEAGYKLFRQDRHNLAGVTTPGKPTRQASLHTITRQHGPSTALVWELPGRGRILLDGWLQWATTKYRYRLSEEVFVGQTYSATQLNARDRKLYMFFTLSGQVLIR